MSLGGRRAAALALWLLGGAPAQAAPLPLTELAVRVSESPAVQLAEQGVRLARGARDRERVPVRLNLSGGVRLGEVETGVASPLALDPVSLDATLNVVPFGPARAALGRADAALLAAELDLHDARQEGLLTATEGFLAALRGAEEETVLRHSAETARLELGAVRARLSAGAAGENDLLEAQLTLAEAEGALADALLGGAEALGTLSLTLGAEIRAVAGPVPRAEGLLRGAYPEDLERRSDVQRARLRLQEARIADAEVRFGAFPQGSVSVGYAGSVGGQGLEVAGSVGSESGFQPALSLRYTPAAPPDGGALSASLGVSVTLDPALPGLLEASALGVAQAEAELERTRSLAALELKSRERELRAAEAARTLAAQGLELSERLFDGVQQRFELGLVAPADLRRAEGAQLAAALAQRRAEDAVLLAQLRLARALGADLQGAF